MVQSGDKFGNYEVMANASGAADVLGSGSGGTTMRVRHVHLDTIAALKVLRRRAQADSRQGKNFLSEAKSAASLSHPHIARVLDFGENAGVLYYVMDLCEGGSLEDFRNKQGAPDDVAALAWLQQSAFALAHAHDRNILHRDIKPSNLLLARENGLAPLKLIDFGLAGKTDAASGESEPVIGTPLFAAPEQLRGQAEKASDVFSLGASFLWLLTGKHLDTGDLAQVIDRRLAATDYTGLLGELPLAWREVLGAMLRVEPAARVTDGAALVELIERVFAASLPVAPVMWRVVSDEAPPAPAEAVDPESAWLEVDAEWNTVWTSVDELVVDGCRILCNATIEGDARTWDVQVFETPEPFIEEALIPQGPLLQRHAAALGLETVVLHKGKGWRSVAWPILTGKDTLDWLRVNGVPTAGVLLPCIRSLGAGLDLAARDGLGAMELHPALLHLVTAPETEGIRGFAISVYLPSIAAERSSRETASTMSGSLNAPLPVRFAACLYHLLGGRPVPPAAFINNRAYPAVPKLSERSNRYLGQVIAGMHGAASCTEIVDRLSLEERLPGVSGNLSDTLSRSMGSPSASRSVATSPVVPPVLPASSSVPPPPRQETTASTVVSTTPAAPIAKTGSANPKNIILLVAGVVLLAVTAGAGYAVWRFVIARPKPVIVKVADVEPLANSTSTPHASEDTGASSKTSRDSSPSIASAAWVKVPSQVASLAEAAARCDAGGVIEIDGGTYAESIALTKSLTIQVKNGAVMESPGSGGSVIAVKGKAEVKITGLVVRDTSRETSGDPEHAPPLILVADGSSLTLDRCVIDGGGGSGISLINRATAQVSGSRIVRNRWCGVQVASGSKLMLDQSSVLENRTGLLGTQPNTQILINSGSVISRNSRNGVEIAAGAVVRLSGAEVSNSQTGCGISVAGDGSILHGGGKSLICDNKTTGVVVTGGGSIELADCQLERNREHGIQVTGHGKVKIDGSRFQNGLTGIFADGGGTTVQASHCDFVKHGDSGVVASAGRVELTHCGFVDNALAAIFTDGASGSATSNKVSPGPVEEVILLENAGQVQLSDNTVE